MIKDRDGGAQKHEFFKVLMDGFEKELRIPPAFAKYVINLRGKKTTLISPLGNSWGVSIHGQNRDVSFREGWPELAQAHELKMGYLMVFSYEDNRTFSFKVFDRSACKKNYGLLGAHRVEQIDIKQDLDSENDSEASTIQRGMMKASRRWMRMLDGGESSIKGNCSSCGWRKSFEAIIKKFNLTRNYTGIPASFRASNDIGTKHEVVLNDVEGQSWHIRICNRGTRGVFFTQGWKNFCADKRLEVGDRCIFELASMKDDNFLVRIVKWSTGMEQGYSPCMNWEEHYYWDHFETRSFHFLKVMDSDFSQRMIIPKKFVKNFKEELSQNILLEGPSGNIWHVRPLKDAEDVTFKNGWKQFVEAHYIKEDDLLVFKYNGNSCFSVLIFDQTGCEKEACYFVKGPKDKVKESCQAEEEIVWDSLEILHESVPPKPYNHGSSKMLSNGRQKVQHLLATHKRKANFSSNSINENEQIVMPIELKKQRIEKELQFNLRSLVTEEGKAQARLKAESFQSANPFFPKVMKLSHVHTKFFLSIPNFFAAEHLPRKKQTMVLRLPHGKKLWRTSYLFYDGHSGLGYQWKKFASDNHLEEGDACVFELTGELLLDVHIFRVVNDTTQPSRGSIEK